MPAAPTVFIAEQDHLRSWIAQPDALNLAVAALVGSTDVLVYRAGAKLGGPSFRRSLKWRLLTSASGSARPTRRPLPAPAPLVTRPLFFYGIVAMVAALSASGVWLITVRAVASGWRPP